MQANAPTPALSDTLDHPYTRWVMAAWNPAVPDDLLRRARDAGYTAVGFGVLALQRLQVQRRALAKDLGQRIGGRAGVGRIVRQAEAAVDPVLDGFEKALPGAARSVFHQARQAGKIVERVLLS